eukprot:4758570-Alexandrium_andersonii.AAC.1
MTGGGVALGSPAFLLAFSCSELAVVLVLAIGVGHSVAPGSWVGGWCWHALPGFLPCRRSDSDFLRSRYWSTGASCLRPAGWRDDG